MVTRKDEIKPIEKQLLSFIFLLRQAGLIISHCQTIDALTALSQVIDWTKKEQIKFSLRSFLITHKEDISTFDALFNLYFQEESKRNNDLEKLRKEREAEKVIAAEQSLFTQAWSLPTHALFVTGRQLLPTEAMKIYAQLPPVLKKQIKLQLNRAVVENQDLGAVSAEIIQFLDKWEIEQKKEEPALDLLVGQLVPISNNIRQTDLGKLKTEEMEKMQFYLAKLSKKLAVLFSHRLKITANKKKLDLRKTIRKNLGSGGVIFHLVYQAKKINKPKITLFCDVSGSMANYSLFTLQLLYGLGQTIDKLETFLFGTDLESVTHYFAEKNKDFQQISRKIRENSLQWRGGTALGSSLHTFFRRFPHTVNEKTTVIIISDGATRDQEAALVYLQRLQEQAKSILWLNPKPEAEWATTSSKVFAEHFPMFECRNIEQLEQSITNEFFQ